MIDVIGWTILILFFGGPFVLGLILVSYKDWCAWYKNKKYYQYIDFKSFVSFYKMNPDRWELEKEYVKFNNGYNVSRDPFKRDFYTYLHFNFKDLKKYKKWKRNIEKQKWQLKNIETLNEILSVVKQDIRKFEQENEARMNEATDNINDIISRILKED